MWFELKDTTYTSVSKPGCTELVHRTAAGWELHQGLPRTTPFECRAAPPYDSKILFNRMYLYHPKNKSPAAVIKKMFTRSTATAERAPDLVVCEGADSGSNDEGESDVNMSDAGESDEDEEEDSDDEADAAAKDVQCDPPIVGSAE